MAEGKKGPDMVAHTKKTLLIFSLTTLGVMTAKACQDQGVGISIYPAATTTYDDIDIGDNIDLKPSTLIYIKPDDAIERKSGNKPNVDEGASLTITRVACIGPNGEFKIYDDAYQAAAVLANGYRIEAYQIAANGDIIGYVVPSAVTKKQKIKTIGAYNG